jgi:hypothetical protein
MEAKMTKKYRLATHGWVCSYILLLVAAPVLAMSKESAKEELSKAQVQAEADLHLMTQKFMTVRLARSVADDDDDDLSPKDVVKEAACGRGDSCTDIANKD